MNNLNLKEIAENLIETFQKAGEEAVNIYKKGLKVTIKKDGSPVTNGDLKVNEILTEKISKITPNIPIISEETVDLTQKNKLKTLPINNIIIKI